MQTSLWPAITSKEQTELSDFVISDKWHFMIGKRKIILRWSPVIFLKIWLLENQQSYLGRHPLKFSPMFVIVHAGFSSILCIFRTQYHTLESWKHFFPQCCLACCNFLIWEFPEESKIYVIPVSELFVSLQMQLHKKFKMELYIQHNFQYLLGNGKQPREEKRS